MSKVSIIIPVYNRIKELMIPVNSILEQSFTDWELILVDDGSSDGSSNLCDKLMQQDTRIRAVHQANSGVSAARNHGLAISNGEYVLFIDSDDWIEKNTLNQIVARIEKDKSDIVLFAMNIDRFRGKEINTTTLLYGEDVILDREELNTLFVDLFYKDYLASSCTKLFRKSVIEKNHLQFCADLVMYEDFYFVMDYLSKIQKISVANQAYYHYRMDETVLLIEKRKPERLLENLDKVAKRVLEFVKDSEIYHDKRLQKMVFEFYIMYIYKLFISKGYTNAERRQELKRLLQCPGLIISEKSSRGADSGKFYEMLRVSIQKKSSLGLWLVGLFRYKR